MKYQQINILVLNKTAIELIEKVSKKGVGVGKWQ